MTDYERSQRNLSAALGREEALKAEVRRLTQLLVDAEERQFYFLAIMGEKGDLTKRLFEMMLYVEADPNSQLKLYWKMQEQMSRWIGLSGALAVVHHAVEPDAGQGVRLKDFASPDDFRLFHETATTNGDRLREVLELQENLLKKFANGNGQ